MSGIRRGFGNDLTPPVIPVPDQAWIARESFRSGEVFRAKVFPKTALAPECGDATLGGNARACQHRDGPRLGEVVAGAVEISHRVSLLGAPSVASDCGVQAPCGQCRNGNAYPRNGWRGRLGKP